MSRHDPENMGCMINMSVCDDPEDIPVCTCSTTAPATPGEAHATQLARNQAANLILPLADCLCVSVTLIDKLTTDIASTITQHQAEIEELKNIVTTYRGGVLDLGKKLVEAHEVAKTKDAELETLRANQRTAGTFECCNNCKVFIGAYTKACTKAGCPIKAAQGIEP
jgi:hypothetical protein